MEKTGILIGKMLGRYRLEKLLARGRVEVYLGRDERLERPVAVKIGTLAAMQAAFQAEARLTATLDHPNILPVYDVGTQESVAYLVMHYASGGSLADRLRAASSNGGLPLEEAAYYLDQAAAALEYTHTRGIIHNNLKPTNLLMRERWLMLGDFAQARRPGQPDQAPTSATSSTLAYLAPERRASAEAGPPADLYSLGVLLYQMLWGQLPHTDPGGRLASKALREVKPLPPLAALRQRQREAIEILFTKALAARPQERHTSAGALAAEFRAIVAAPGVWSGVGQKTPEEFPIICPTCGFLNKPQARFCRNDGTRLPVICPRCGVENRPEAKFCQNDGTELLRVCPTCGALNPRQASVCQNDQTPLARICPACGFENPLRARFCERDGAQLR